MRSSEHYDAFLSYDSSNKVEVLEVAERLREQGLGVFLDAWELVPGEPWQEQLERGLEASRAVVVFVGAKGLGSWQLEEVSVALNERLRAEEVRVIPVLLPGASASANFDALPYFLRRLTWVDLRQGLDGRGLRHLVWGIQGIATPKKSVRPTLGPEPTAPLRGSTRLWGFATAVTGLTLTLLAGWIYAGYQATWLVDELTHQAEVANEAGQRDLGLLLTLEALERCQDQELRESLLDSLAGQLGLSHREGDIKSQACLRAGRNLTRGEWRDYLGNLPYRQTCTYFSETARR